MSDFSIVDYGEKDAIDDILDHFEVADKVKLGLFYGKFNCLAVQTLSSLTSHLAACS